MFSSSEICLEDRVEKKPFRSHFTFGSDCVRNKSQWKGVFFIIRIINTSVGILCCGYGHYRMLRAIIRNVVPFPGCGKELRFLGTCRDPFSF